MSEFFSDLRYAGRALQRRPGFAVLVIAIMALGIGANTAVFSVVNGVLLKPLPYPGADQIVTLRTSFLTTGSTQRLSPSPTIGIGETRALRSRHWPRTAPENRRSARKPRPSTGGRHPSMRCTPLTGPTIVRFRSASSFPVTWTMSWRRWTCVGSTALRFCHAAAARASLDSASNRARPNRTIDPRPRPRHA
jgi:hypothetical protein